MNKATQAFRESLQKMALETGLDDGMGFFPPDSELRRVAAEIRVFLASGRALLLQVAHPSVGQAVNDHSNFKADPLGRGFRTFGALYIMGFGRQKLAINMGTHVFHVHQKISGSFPEAEGVRAGKKYSAMERDATMWVMATLIEGVKFAYDEIDPTAMQGARLEAMYRDFLTLGRFFNIKPESMPPTYPEFQAYFDDFVQNSLTVTPSARRVADALVGKKMKFPFNAGAWGLRVLAAETLPVKIRDEFEIESTAATRAAYKALRGAMRTVHANAPQQLTTLPLAWIPAGRTRLDHLLSREAVHGERFR